MENKMIFGIVSVVVGIIVLAGVLIPVLDSLTEKNDTFKNTGYYNMSYEQSDAVDLSWDHTKPSVVTVNGVDYTFSNVDQNRVTIVCGDDWVVRFQTSTNDISYWSPNKSIFGSVSNSVDFSLTAADGSVTVANTASTPATETTTYTEMYCIDKDGSFVMKKATEGAYLNKDSPIFALGTTSLESTTALIKLEGSINDGITGTIYRATGATLDNIEMVYTEDPKHIDLYNLTEINAVATFNGTDYDVKYTYFIVPYEVTAEKSVHLSDAMSGLLNVIPVFIIVALLLLAVRYFINRNY